MAWRDKRLDRPRARRDNILAPMALVERRDGAERPVIRFEERGRTARVGDQLRHCRGRPDMRDRAGTRSGGTA